MNHSMKLLSLLFLTMFTVIISLRAGEIRNSVNTQDLSKVRVEQGLLLGSPGADPSIIVFKGVPFAMPPVGELRWRAPQPPASWDGIRNADKFSPNGMQEMRESYGPWTSEYQPQGAVSEDCLYLNIWTAAKSSTEKLPVMVYIPGGAFTGGSGNVPVYNGENLAKKGIIVVTVNYRLGVLGFFAHPELTKESENKSSGNYGLLDQVAALEWVKKNIEAFSGDPNHVTIMGQSAGAMSVHCLVASPLAKGLFSQAIALSGSNAMSGPGGNLAFAEQTGVKFAEAKGTASLAALRGMPANDLMALMKNEFRFTPIIDGWFLPKNIDQIISAGEQNDVITLTGWVADEGSYSDNYGKASAETFKNMIKQQTGIQAEEILKLYPASTESEVVESQKAFSREMSMLSMYLWAAKHRTNGKTNVYTYIFTHPQPGVTKDRYMTFHSSELPYVFNNLNQSNRPWTGKDTIIAETMSDYWKNFIATGNPNGKGLPKWEVFKEISAETMELGDSMGMRPIVSKEKFEVLMKLHGAVK